RVGAFVVVRAADDDVIEAAQLLAHALDVGVEEADDVDGGEGDLLLPVAEDDRAGEKRVRHPGCLPVMPEPSDVDRLLANFGGNVNLAEADAQLGRTTNHRVTEDTEQSQEEQTRCHNFSVISVISVTLWLVHLCT